MKILLVDDDGLAAEMTSAILESEDHEVVLANHGIEALEILSGMKDIEMIISDLHMPFLDGLELFAEARTQGYTMPFVLLTGDDPKAALEAQPGLDACLLKDFSLQDDLPSVIARIMA